MSRFSVRDFGERINVQGWIQPRLCAVIGWWGNGCLFGKNDQHHKLTSGARALASSKVSLPYLALH